MNQRVMEGLACTALNHLEEYVDAQIRSICAGMPKGVSYSHYEVCTPDEEYAEITRERGSKRFFNLAKTTIYLVKYYFEFIDAMGEVHSIVKHIYLPYVQQGGTIVMSGTEMHLIPVLSDKVFTVNKGSIFVRLVQDRNNFFRMYHSLTINDRRETRYVAHAVIYRNSAKSKNNSKAKSKPKTVLPHYLFARYGVTGAFQRYAGVVPVFGDKRSITPEHYPPDEWYICQSTNICPNPKIINPIPVNIRVAVRKSDWSTAMECLIVGMFYVMDHFPERFRTLDTLDDTALWMILIGIIRIGEDYPENKLLKSIQEHFETINPYIDQSVHEKLAEIGVEVENYFDLLNHIQVIFNDMVAADEDNSLSVYGKNMEFYQSVAYDILYGVTSAKFRLNKIALRNNLTKNDVEDAIRREIRMGAIFQLNSGKKIFCEVVGYSGDHLYPKITAIVAEQENRSGGQRGKKQRVSLGPAQYLDLSMLEAGSLLNLPKSNPTPLARINPWITLDEKTNTVLPNPKFRELLQEKRKLFKR